MKTIKEAWKAAVAAAVADLLREKGADPSIAAAVVAETPPDASMGDIGFPMFPLAKPLRMGPPQIAVALAERMASSKAPDGVAKAIGPYLNVFVDRASLAAAVLSARSSGEAYGRSASLAGTRIMMEFSSPNTNKPLHLGHLRNDALGESTSRILKANGAEVLKINLVNDRGVHICKSMLSYMAYGEGRTPDGEGMKSDHFVGDYYVKFNDLKKEDPKAEEKAQELLVKWEAGDPETIALWKTMNEWAVGGIRKTYERTGISFDKYYYESQIYLTGKEEVQKGLASGAFFRAPDGSVRIDLSPIGLEEKVLLRKDGTSIYMTQDIGLAIHRHNDWPFDRLVYVVANEQQYHFKVLFHILASLGYEWARNLYHLSYGLVNLPEGRMKTREGTVVDADTLLDSLRELAIEEIQAKGREDAVGDMAETAEKIALGAVHYYLAQATPAKDMVFNPKESLSFNGNTGPYIQYMGARISSLLRKRDLGEGKASQGTVRPELLTAESEWELVRLVAAYPEAVELAGAEYNPAVVAAHLYAIASAFSKFYHDEPILTCDDADIAATRLALSEAVLVVLKNGLRLLCIPFLEAM
ncbi:MAG: arginine--tRNA ligase [Spirochaetae bacterium HGW-Spirochaetae-7]|nr:MAG: arginine--tRNA ligase [Spirochaetae bacterium HGW-Spirochaetae-7]